MRMAPNFVFLKMESTDSLNFGSVFSNPKVRMMQVNIFSAESKSALWINFVIAIPTMWYWAFVWKIFLHFCKTVCMWWTYMQDCKGGNVAGIFGHITKRSVHIFIKWYVIELSHNCMHKCQAKICFHFIDDRRSGRQLFQWWGPRPEEVVYMNDVMYARNKICHRKLTDVPVARQNKKIIKNSFIEIWWCNDDRTPGIEVTKHLFLV